MKYKSFIFLKYEIDESKNEFRFFYSLENKINFVEKLALSNEKIVWKNVNKKALDKVLFNLHLALGVSYWKMYCPKEIIINSGVLNKSQADFWNKLYTKGLGEFYYKNKIDFRKLVRFPFSNSKTSTVKLKLKNRSLVPHGGGKDSIVTAEFLRQNKHDFDIFSLNTSLIQDEVAKIIKKKQIIIKREVDPQIFTLNSKGVYNGHVPITSIYSFTALLVSVLLNYKNIVFSNEHSANYGNVKYLGQEINHQYSKSLEFENDFIDYLKKNISPSFVYFSLLRPFSELKIVELFSKQKKYFKYFSSCNRNFKINKKSEKRWCGECSKCVFVFTQLSAFLDKEVLLKIFQKNLYQDKKLLKTFLELLGEKNIKPFDCVGTPEETRLAIALAISTGKYDNDYIIKYFNKLYVNKVFSSQEIYSQSKHNIPREFNKILAL